MVYFPWDSLPLLVFPSLWSIRIPFSCPSISYEMSSEPENITVIDSHSFGVVGQINAVLTHVTWPIMNCSSSCPTVCNHLSRGVQVMVGAVNPDSFDTLHSYSNTFQMPFLTPSFPEKVSQSMFNRYDLYFTGSALLFTSVSRPQTLCGLSSANCKLINVEDGDHSDDRSVWLGKLRRELCMTNSANCWTRTRAVHYWSSNMC